MGLFLGIDAGGTKTECVLADEAGAAVARALGEGANLRRTSATELRAILGECLEKLQQQAGLARLECDAVCGGFAGAGLAEARLNAEEVLRKLLRPKLLAVVGDMEVALEAAVGAGPGVVLIAGTGSIAFGRNAAGKTARAGGKGFEEGDEGSGVNLGRLALDASKRNPGSLLCAGVLRAGVPPVESPAEFAKLVPVVVSAAQKGDSAAKAILTRAASDLAGLAVAILRDLDLMAAGVEVATSGGVFAESEEVHAQVRSLILAAAPRARVEQLHVSPAEGAARMAQRLWLEQQAGRG
jgi:N-acetylglucosamine kinase-like BadF-type ATPase